MGEGGGGWEVLGPVCPGEAGAREGLTPEQAAEGE